MEIRIGYRPFPIHEGFHKTAVREKCAMGAVGSGKTIALCGDAIALGLDQPGSRILVARQTVNSLKDTTETEFVGILTAGLDDEQSYERDESGKAFYDLCKVSRLGGHIDRIVFPNGTEYLFRSLDDWKKHMSLNLAAVYIDEASEVSQDAYNGLKTRLRQRLPTPLARRQGVRWDPRRIRQHIALATNPNGHDWIWEYFINDPTLERRCFKSTSFDNPTLYEEDGRPSAYLRSLLDLPEMFVRRYVLCEHDAFEGQILEYTDDQMETYFAPPKDWDRAMGLDWGLRNPTAVVWWARKPGTKRWYQYREWQTYDSTDATARDSRVTMNVHQVAAKIHMLEQHPDGTKEHIKYRAADPAIKNRMGESAKSIEYWFATHKLYFQLGTKDYSSRINSLNQLLHDGELVLLDNCQQTGIAFQQYRWADLSPSAAGDGAEKPHKKNDHLVDASQYLATIFAQSRAVPEQPAEQTFSDLVWERVKKQVRKPKKRTTAYSARVRQ